MLPLSSVSGVSTVIYRTYTLVCLFCAGFTLRPFISCIYSFYTFFSANYHLNAIQIGALTSIPVFCMGIFAITGRYLENYFVREWIIVASTTLIACGFLLRSLTHSVIIMFVATIMGGVGMGVGGSLIGGFVREHLPEHAINGLGIYSLGIGLGAIFGSEAALSSWPANQFILCMVVSGCTLAFGSVFCSWQKIKSRPRLAVSLHDQAATQIYRPRGQQAAGREPKDGRIAKAAFVLHGRSKRHTLMMRCMVIIIFGLQSLINYTILVWIKACYQYLADFPEINSNQIVLTVLEMQLIASFLVPQVLGKVKNKLIPMGVLAGILNGSILLWYFYPVSMCWIIVMGIGFSTGAIFPLSLSLPVIFSQDARQASSWFTTMLFWGYLISAMGPILFGLMLSLSSSYDLALSVLSGLALTLLLAIYILNHFASAQPQHPVSHDLLAGTSTGEGSLEPVDRACHVGGEKQTRF